MKLMKVIGLLMVSLFFSSALAQEPTRCGTDAIITKQLQDPKFARSYNEIVKLKHSQQQKALSNNVLTIPVVVHVYHDGDDYGTGSNIADEVIYDAIANLNACFAGEPWHTTSHSGVTHPYSDSNIEFCLASIDPDGNSTTGITRHNPDSLGTYTTQGMITTSGLPANSETALKSLSVWDVEKYCNIWVLHKLNGGSSPLGFAYLPPNNNSVADGIVCYVNVFGFEEPWLINNFNKNGTLVHEMGHYLGLLHTFGNTSTCNSETNCVTQGDKLCDTPPTTGTVGCSPISCPETMVENFMDYSNDPCMDRFSPDGVTRMRTQLLAYRPELLDPTNMACGTVDGLDAGVSNITINNIGCSETLSNVTYDLINFGDTLTETTINYNINGELDFIIWTGNLGPGEIETITLPDYIVGYGLVDIEVNVAPLGDINASNNTTSLQVNNYQGDLTTVTIDYDLLPYGIDWAIYQNIDGVWVKIHGWFQNNTNETSCTTTVSEFCLDEGGEYEFRIEDLFGNGMHYPFCDENPTAGDVTITNSVGDTLVYLSGNWGYDEQIPFTVGISECIPPSCPGDVDGNGFIWMNDILLLLQYFGSEVEPCNTLDVDQDGIVGVNDVLEVIANFDSSCETGELAPEDDFEVFLKRENEGNIVRTTLYNVMGQEVRNTDYLDTGIYIIVQEWNVPDVGTIITKKKIFRE